MCVGCCGFGGPYSEGLKTLLCVSLPVAHYV